MPFYLPFVYVASNHRLFFTGNQVFFIIIYFLHGPVAKLVDALDLGSSGETHGGSNPPRPTKRYTVLLKCGFLSFWFQRFTGLFCCVLFLHE